jgi:anti-sigma factor RsiW
MRPPEPPDGELWQRSQAIKPAGDAQRFLDLAAFADNRLDHDETERVAGLVAGDPDAAADVAAARILADAVPMTAPEAVIARAAALVTGPLGTAIDAPRVEAVVIAFPAQHRVAPRPWFPAIASWSGLAAAIAFAGWLGFDLGSGFSNFSPLGRADGVSASEVFDLSPPLVRDFVEGWQT